MTKLKYENQIICGDTLKTLKQMPSEIISCCMFSPPYWSLRDYKVEGQIGLEKDFNEYLAKMWAIFDELWRVLRKDGTMWVNMGDGYGGNQVGVKGAERVQGKTAIDTRPLEERPAVTHTRGQYNKSLFMLPERLMLGLLDRGWILRNKCIWQKPNPMPCSAKDRFTTTWEYLFFLTKSKKYWFDLDAVRRPHAQCTIKRTEDFVKRGEKFDPDKHKMDEAGGHQNPYEILESTSLRKLNPAGKNPGDVITTKIPQEDAEKMGSPRARQWRSAKWEDVPGQSISGQAKHRHDHNDRNHPAGANPGDVITENKICGGGQDRNSESKILLEFTKNTPPLPTDPTDFWSIPTQPSKLAHYASYPERLCETPLKAGCPRWICKQCGMARMRVTKPTNRYAKCLKPHRINYVDIESIAKYIKEKRIQKGLSTIQVAELGYFYGKVNHGGSVSNWEACKSIPTIEEWNKLKEILELDNRYDKQILEFSKQEIPYEWNKSISSHHSLKTTLNAEYHTLGWSFCSCLCPACSEADCKCGEKWRPGIVLDPFVGTGVTCIVAKKLGLSYLGIDIKKEYCEMAEKRLKDVQYQEKFEL